MPDNPLLECPNCRLEIPPEEWRDEQVIRCRACGAPRSTQVFPVLVNGVAPGQPGQPLLEAEHASCFYHATRRAEHACDHCGRFVCSLCDLKVGNLHLCPGCLEEHAEETPGIFALQGQRMLYEEVAFLLAALPLLIGFCVWYIWIVTAPAAIATAVWSWRKPGKLMGRPKVKRIFAIALALLQIVLWVIIIRRPPEWLINAFAD